MTWYDVRQDAIIVFGPDPATLVEPISVSDLKSGNPAAKSA